MTRLIRTGRRVACGVIIAGAMTACLPAGVEPLSADSTCAEYFDRDGQERRDAAVRISVELQLDFPGNPLWGPQLDASCGRSPSQTIREAFGQ